MLNGAHAPLLAAASDRTVFQKNEMIMYHMTKNPNKTSERLH